MSVSNNLCLCYCVGGNDTLVGQTTVQAFLVKHVKHGRVDNSRRMCMCKSACGWERMCLERALAVAEEGWRRALANSFRAVGVAEEGSRLALPNS